MIKHVPLDYSELPTPGTRIAIDAEFVSMQQEESDYHSEGSKKIIRPARHGLARVSVLRADGKRAEIPFIDDHIHTTEPIVDYLTEYSGIQPGDLDPRVSPHTLTPLKVVYKKLRLLVDLGCIFIGHGLKQDFRIINIYVPPEQVLDTVNIYYLPSRQRRISLRFLSWYVLDQRIQDGVHDSIEDAKFALLLYKKYDRLNEDGEWEEFLEDLYKAGRSHQWKPPAVPDEVHGPEHGLAGFMSSNSNLNILSLAPNPLYRFNSMTGNIHPTSQSSSPRPYRHMSSLD
jgi:PAB-dependent poly(A)-specific ribonuclease subunit 2